MRAGVEHLASDLLTVRPTIMTVVPRILEVIRARILDQIGAGAAVAAAPVRARAGDRAAPARRPRSRSLDRLADPRARPAGAPAQVRGRFGGRLRAAMSGGARLEPEVGRFFLAMGMPMMQGYGQTEAGPVISANPPDAIRIDTRRPALAGRGAADRRRRRNPGARRPGDGRLLGPARGHRAGIRDGWLHTGDIGVLDADGYLRITDRKKDIIVLSGGENVSPAQDRGHADGRTGDRPGGRRRRGPRRAVRPARAGGGRATPRQSRRR